VDGWGAADHEVGEAAGHGVAGEAEELGTAEVMEAAVAAGAFGDLCGFLVFGTFLAEGGFDGLGESEFEGVVLHGVDDVDGALE